MLSLYQPTFFMPVLYLSFHPTHSFTLSYHPTHSITPPTLSPHLVVTDHSGSIDVEEVSAVLKSLGHGNPHTLSILLMHQLNSYTQLTHPLITQFPLHTLLYPSLLLPLSLLTFTLSPFFSPHLTSLSSPSSHPCF